MYHVSHLILAFISSGFSSTVIGYVSKKKAMGLSHGPYLTHRSMGSLSRSAHGLFLFLSVQAVEGRPVPKAKVPKIKETILLFSCHHHDYS